MKARPEKKTSKAVARQSPKKKPSGIQKILTAEGWKRLILGRSNKTKK